MKTSRYKKGYCHAKSIHIRFGKTPNDDTPGLFRVRITSELADCADLKF